MMLTAGQRVYLDLQPTDDEAQDEIYAVAVPPGTEATVVTDYKMGSRPGQAFPIHVRIPTIEDNIEGLTEEFLISEVEVRVSLDITNALMLSLAASVQELQHAESGGCDHDGGTTK